MIGLFKQKNVELFPITSKEDIYIKGLRIRSLSNYLYIEEKGFEQMCNSSHPGTKMISKYANTLVTYEDYQIMMDIIRNRVKIHKDLEEIYLTDINKQAQFISKTLKCLCTTLQIRKFQEFKHPIKQRLRMPRDR